MLKLIPRISLTGLITNFTDNLAGDKVIEVSLRVDEITDVYTNNSGSTVNTKSSNYRVKETVSEVFELVKNAVQEYNDTEDDRQEDKEHLRKLAEYIYHSQSESESFEEFVLEGHEPSGHVYYLAAVALGDKDVIEDTIGEIRDNAEDKD